MSAKFIEWKSDGMKAELVDEPQGTDIKDSYWYKYYYSDMPGCHKLGTIVPIKHREYDSLISIGYIVPLDAKGKESKIDSKPVTEPLAEKIPEKELHAMVKQKSFPAAPKNKNQGDLFA